MKQNESKQTDTKIMEEEARARSRRPHVNARSFDADFDLVWQGRRYNVVIRQRGAVEEATT